MTDREKLVAWIRDVSKFHEEVTEKWILGGKQGERPNLIASIADYLIANGVAVLPLQVGDTVYGRFSSRGSSVHECRVINNKLCQFKDGSVHNFLEVEFDIIDPYYNDGRLMRCWHQAVYGEDFGSWDRVYLTREEAEAQSLKGVE